MNRKADAGLTAIVIIVVIIIFLGWLVNLSHRECHSNKDCRDDQYCGSDFACHKIPVIEKETTPVIVHRSYAGAAWIIGIAMVITAVIFNIDKISRVFSKKVEKEPEEKVYTNIPIYYEKHTSK